MANDVSKPKTAREWMTRMDTKQDMIIRDLGELKERKMPCQSDDTKVNPMMRMEVIETKMRTHTWVLRAIGSGVIAAFILWLKRKWAGI